LIRNNSPATRLALLIAGTMLPMILFAAGVVYLNHALVASSCSTIARDSDRA